MHRKRSCRTPTQEACLPRTTTDAASAPWDGCSAANASIPNGSFETVLLGLPAGWWRTYGTDGAVDTGPLPPVDGTNYARVWHEGPLSCYLRVSAGTPVTLNFHARAVVPPHVADMPPGPDVATPAPATARPRPTLK